MAYVCNLTVSTTLVNESNDCEADLPFSSDSRPKKPAASLVSKPRKPWLDWPLYVVDVSVSRRCGIDLTETT